ncbi:MAG: TonB-dependent receptor, partial [Acidobacteria bacterium]|nr:TonB-dependent receptor [Acidobacteriota bacterium]
MNLFNLPRRSILPILALLATGPGSASLALEEASVEEAAAATTPAGEEKEQKIRDEIFVEGELPDIPTANTVAAKLPLSLLQTPASVSVVEAPLFQERQSFVLGDALKNVSGMNVQTFNGVFDFFVVRGMDSVSSGLVQTDGVPEPEASFYQLYNVERVEVLKGPAAFLYGDSPLVGTVNLVRKQPERATFGSFGISGGSFGTFEGTLDLNTVSQDEKVSLRLNGLWQQSDGYRDDKESDNLAINPALTWRPNDSTSVNLNLEYVDTEYSTDSGLPILFTGEVADVPRERSYQSPFDVSDQEIGRIQVDVEKVLSPRFTLRNKTYYRNLEWLSSGTIFNGAFPNAQGSLELSRFLSSLEDTQTFVGNQFEVLWQAETGSVTHNLLAGVELARRSDEFNFNVFFLPGIDVFNPVETASEPLFPLPGQATAADATNDVISPYVIDQINLSDRFQLLLGARYDHIEFDNTVSGIERTNDELSPMVGAVFAATDSLTFYANAGEAFALPSTFVIDDTRKPETSRQVELGAKKSFRGGRIHSSLAAFRIDRENIAIPDDF